MRPQTDSPSPAQPPKWTEPDERLPPGKRTEPEDPGEAVGNAVGHGDGDSDRDCYHDRDDSLTGVIFDPDLFQDPIGYYRTPEPARWVDHRLPLSGQMVHLRLVGSNPLWANHIWNAALSLSLYLQRQSISTDDSGIAAPLVNPGVTTVLEFGAAAGLPSITAAILGARTVVATDYLDEEIQENLRVNVNENAHLFPSVLLRSSPPGIGSEDIQERIKNARVEVEPHLWGSDPGPLLSHLISDRDRVMRLSHPQTDGQQHQYSLLPASDMTQKSSISSTFPSPADTNDSKYAQSSLSSAASYDGFSLILMADVLYTPHSHIPLLQSLRRTLSRSDPTARALVFACPYRPWLWERDLKFFEMCEETYEFEDDESIGADGAIDRDGQATKKDNGNKGDGRGRKLQVNPLGKMEGGRVMFPDDPGFDDGDGDGDVEKENEKGSESQMIDRATTQEDEHKKIDERRSQVWGWEITWSR